MTIILSCPCSGTKFITDLFKRVGLNVGHERFGRNGIAYWRLVGGPENTRGAGPVKMADQRVLHQVREPLAAIGAIQTIGFHSWIFLRNQGVFSDMRESRLTRAAKVWVEWNKRAEKISKHTYRVENLKSIWEQFCGWTGIEADVSILDTVPPDTNTRKGKFERPPVSLNALRKANAKLCDEVVALATHYGYEVR